MPKDKPNIEQRLRNIKGIYNKLSEYIEALPSAVPEQVRKMLKKVVLENEELKEIIESVDHVRPPKFLVIGRTGVGKSSLVNALCDSYVAGISDVRSCTTGVRQYECKDGERTLMSILDTRGLAESESLDESETAEKALLEQVIRFSPDAAILLLGCTHRDGVDEDSAFLKKLAGEYEKANRQKLPIVVAVNKCDEMQPSREKCPERYTEGKKRKINEAVEYFRGILQKSGIEINEIIAVSSYIEWGVDEKKDDASEIRTIDTDDIENMTEDELEGIVIAFDGRYHIQELKDILEEAIPDYEAKAGLRMAEKTEKAAKSLANCLVNTFSGIASLVAMTPIPVSDMYILLLLESILVVLIAYLGGYELSAGSGEDVLKVGKDFVLSGGGVTAVGFLAKTVFQQSSKLLNTLFPAAGSVISASVAVAGIQTIGKLAITYYIEGK